LLKQKTAYELAKRDGSSLVKKEVDGKTQLGVPVAEMQAKADELNAKKDFSVNINAAKTREEYKQAGQNAVPPGTQPRDGNKIRVKINSTGEKGVIDATEFDPAIYTKI